eukprot:3514000-Pleurochrysis_carterae.AAC.1
MRDSDSAPRDRDDDAHEGSGADRRRLSGNGARAGVGVGDGDGDGAAAGADDGVAEDEGRAAPGGAESIATPEINSARGVPRTSVSNGALAPASASASAPASASASAPGSASASAPASASASAPASASASAPTSASASALEEIVALTSGYSGADLLALVRAASIHAAQRASAASLGASVRGASKDGDAWPSASHVPNTYSPEDATFASAASSSADSSIAACAASPSLTPTALDFRAAAATVGASSLRSVAAPVEPLAWSDIGGLEDVKLRLERAVRWPLERASALERLGVRPARGVLLHGPPGCSKTSLARAAAGSAAATFLHLSGAQVSTHRRGLERRRSSKAKIDLAGKAAASTESRHLEPPACADAPR